MKSRSQISIGLFVDFQAFLTYKAFERRNGWFSELLFIVLRFLLKFEHHLAAKEKLPFKEEELRFSRGQADVSVEQSVEGFGAFGQFGEVSVFQGLGERVEQAPDVTTFKGIMTGLSPFMKHFRDQTVGANADIGRPDDEVVGFGVGDLGFFVGGDAFVLIVPFGEQETDGATDELGEVADDEPCVFAREFDLTRK